MEKLLADADETTASHALDALATLGEPAVPGLVNALKHKKLRPHVVSILGRIGPSAAPATPSLVALVHDEDIDTANEAVHALAKIGPGAKQAVPELIKAVENPESPVHRAAIYALGKMGPDAQSAEPALLKLMKHADCKVSLLSAWALIEIKGPSAETAAVVLPTLETDLAAPLPHSRKGAAEVLGRLGPFAKSAVACLQKAAADEDADVRAAAAKALEAIQK